MNLLGKPERERPLERFRHKWKDKIDLTENEWDDTDWFDLAQARDQWRSLVNTVMNLWMS
jgi:hypothetical protein